MAKKRTNPAEQITNLLTAKAGLKQTIYRDTLSRFKTLKSIVKELQDYLEEHVSEDETNISVKVTERGEFDIEFKFSGDTLVFSMHSNVFCVEGDVADAFHSYFEADRRRLYCGMINIYNFMSDSYKYSRMNDIGILVGRIFINHEGNFFVEGKKELGRNFRHFDTQRFDEESIRNVVNTAVVDALNADLTPPPYENVQSITLQQKLSEVGSAGLHVGKRLGFEVRGSL